MTGEFIALNQFSRIVHVEITNPGIDPLVGSKIKFTTSSAGVTFPEGDSFDLAELAPAGTVSVDVPVQLGVLSDAAVIQLDYDITNEAAIEPSLKGSVFARVNYDNALAVSTVDDVESDIEVWTEETLVADDLWKRLPTDPAALDTIISIVGPGVGFCFGILNLLIALAFGALGGWLAVRNRPQPLPPIEPLS